MFTVGPIHTWDHDPGFSSTEPEPAAREKREWVLFICLYMNVTGTRVPAHPSEHLEELR